MSICRMTFIFPFRPIWFNQLKSPTEKKKQNKTEASTLTI